MRTAVFMGLLFVLAGTAVGDEFTWALPDGADGGAVLERVRDTDSWPDVVGAASWMAAVRGASRSGGGPGRFTLDLEVPEGADFAALDRVVAACYETYARERLPALPVLIQKAREVLAEAEKAAGERRTEMRRLLESGAGVVDRERAIAASAERAEDLRRRIVDARMELAVTEARSRAIREQARLRQQELEERKQQRLAALEQELQILVERKQIRPNGELHGQHRDEIEHLRRQPLAEDERLTGFLRMTADLEVERIAGEERVKVLGESLEDERQRSLSLLDATDLESFRRNQLVPAEREARNRADALAALEKELAAVRSETAPRRVTPDPVTGELPRVYVMGAVNRAGTYLTQEAGSNGPMTLTKLLALAGDFRSDANRGAIKIIRKHTNGVVAITVNFENILDNELEDLEIRPNDIVYVPEKQR